MENNFNINDIQEVIAEQVEKNEKFIETVERGISIVEADLVATGQIKIATVAGGGKLSPAQVAQEITRETLADSLEYVGEDLIDESFNTHIVQRNLDDLIKASQAPAEVIAEGTSLGSVYPSGLIRQSRAINPSTGMRAAVMTGSITVDPTIEYINTAKHCKCGKCDSK